MKFQQNWLDMLQALSHLEEDGKAIFLTEPLGFSSTKGAEFENLINAQGYYIAGVFNAPEKALQLHMSFRPIFY